ncbi:MAG: zinc ABC transporter substrate-binding protein [Chloroflexia bacterium]|nr:zinc ABC transporter substrate-binding protein [Chloroflexia bacterium]
MTSPSSRHRNGFGGLIARLAIIALVGFGGSWLAAAQVGARQTDDAPLKVVATFSILGDWVQQVGRDRVELFTIVGAGGDAHTFDPSPEQVAQIADADIIFEIGSDFEPWLNDIVASSGSSATRAVLTDGLDLIPLSGEEAHSEDAEQAQASPETGEAHDHGPVDPHIWHDVSNATASVERIRDELSAAEPTSATAFAANAGPYLQELHGLDGEIRQQVGQLPEDRRKLVTSHDTFAYFARAYGFEIIGTALGSVSTEAGDPSARQFIELVEQIQATGVPAIFAENVSNPDLMQSIADEAGVTLAPSLYTDALGPPDSTAATYIALIRTNTATIVTALAG